MTQNFKTRDFSSPVEVLDFVILSLVVLGYVSLFILAIYLFSAFLYMLTPESWPGIIAYTPKWIFLFTPLVFLKKSRRIDFLLEKFCPCVLE